jgi:hypothetical protein
MRQLVSDKKQNTEQTNVSRETFLFIVKKRKNHKF